MLSSLYDSLLCEVILDRLVFTRYHAIHLNVSSYSLIFPADWWPCQKWKIFFLNLRLTFRTGARVFRTQGDASDSAA